MGDKRDLVLIDAVLRRISDRGDMAIPISHRTLQRLVRVCGLYWTVPADEPHREVDAIALEALCLMARRNLA